MLDEARKNYFWRFKCRQHGWNITNKNKVGSGRWVLIIVFGGGEVVRTLHGGIQLMPLRAYTIPLSDDT